MDIKPRAIIGVEPPKYVMLWVEVISTRLLDELFAE